MMPGSEERWRDGSGTTAGALGHLLERMTNDFTPQHDSQHYQPGFVPSATPPWTTSSQTPLTSLGSPMPPLQTSHTSLGSQIPPLQSNHTSLGSQVPSMQSAHSNMGPQMSPLQPPTTSAPGGLPPGPQLTGSASRSYSVSQDLFSELDGGRSPLLRSSSDLGLRLSHYHAQGSPYNDGRLDGFMDSSMDSLDGMLVGSPDSAFFLEVQRGPAVSSGTPPLQGDPQGLTSSAVPHPEFSFYSHENDRRMEGESVSNFSAKFSNFTASLGSWFSPLDPFRSNLTAAQAKTPCVTQPSSVGTGLESSRTSETLVSSQCNANVRNVQIASSLPTKANKPSYSDVLSKNPVQEGKLNTGGPAVNSRSSSSNSNSSSSNVTSHPPQSPSPGPTTSRPEQKTRSQPGSNGKTKPRNSCSISSNASNCSNSGSIGHSSKLTSKGDNHISSSRVGLDEFDLNVGSLSNGSISAYEHYDWGEGTSIILGNGPSIFKTSANSPTHQPKKLSVRGDVKKNNSEKISNSLHCEGEEMKGSDQLNNKVTSTQQKQPPRKTSYINNILNATSSPTVPTASATSSGCSSANPQATANHTSTIPITNNATASSTLNFTVTNNNNDSERGDGNKIKSTQMPKEDKKTHDIVGNTSSGGRPGGRNKTTANGRGDRTDRNRENQSKRPVRKRKETPFINHSELVAQGWAVAVHWVGLVVQAVVWLGTLAADVVVMSSRLFLHLMTVIWARFLEYWHTVKISVRHYWARLTSTFWKNDKEEKKIPGREKKIPRGLECNISLPTTGDEAMKRLLACKGKDPYSILGVTQECTDEDIKKYYKRQAFLVHPDKNKQPGAEEAFKILAHAFEIIGEPERRREYDARLAEEVQLEGAWGELASLLTRLQEKLDEAANTIRCTNCNKRHRRVKLPRPIYAARHCAECQIHHAAREGDIWAESTFLGLRWKYYACMEGAVYDISDWAACQSENLKHLQANTHSVQYRIVSGKKSPPSKNNTPEFPSDPDLEEFFNNLCKEKFGKNYASGSSQPGGQQMSDMRKRKNKKKK
ncbi:dnaJ homolog dnj-5-like [Homarus americanus]|uniref:dnaJ homolog dnj-5-like n=1 Tax=Homarus americanus TaxID=6706 RepID=UPI001C497C61|nr:dnaJ homolog dnj-5-like [Homarus americanus]